MDRFGSLQLVVVALLVSVARSQGNGTDFETRSDGFVLLARHKNVSEGFFSENVLESGIENQGEPDANTYSIIGVVDPAMFLLSDESYEFELIYDNFDGTRDVLRWTQRSWLNESSVLDANLSSIIQQYGTGLPGTSFAGLAKSSSNKTYLDGSPDNESWFHAVASIEEFEGGIPAHGGKIANHSELWARIESPSPTSSPTPAPTTAPTPPPTPDPSDCIVCGVALLQQTYPVCDDNGRRYNFSCEIDEYACRNGLELSEAPCPTPIIPFPVTSSTPSPTPFPTLVPINCFFCDEDLLQQTDPVCDQYGQRYNDGCEIKESACQDGLDLYEAPCPTEEPNCEMCVQPSLLQQTDPVCDQYGRQFDRGCELYEYACQNGLELFESPCLLPRPFRAQSCALSVILQCPFRTFIKILDATFGWQAFFSPCTDEIPETACNADGIYSAIDDLCDGLQTCNVTFGAISHVAADSLCYGDTSLTSLDVAFDCVHDVESKCLEPLKGVALDGEAGGAPRAFFGEKVYAFALRFEWHPYYDVPDGGGMVILSSSPSTRDVSILQDIPDDYEIFRYTNLEDDGGSNGPALVISVNEDDSILMAVRLGDRWCTVRPTASAILGLDVSIDVTPYYISINILNDRVASCHMPLDAPYSRMVDHIFGAGDSVAWTSVEARTAAGQVCNFEIDDAEPPPICGDCLRPDDVRRGCEVQTIEECVCAVDWSCCGWSWSEECVDIATSQCDLHCFQSLTPNQTISGEYPDPIVVNDEPWRIARTLSVGLDEGWLTLSLVCPDDDISYVSEANYTVFIFNMETRQLQRIYKGEGGYEYISGQIDCDSTGGGHLEAGDYVVAVRDVDFLSNINNIHSARYLEVLPMFGDEPVDPTDTPSDGDSDVPSISSIQFSEGGTDILLHFDAPTYQGSTTSWVPCEEYFSPSTLSLFGDTPACSWLDAYTLSATFGAGATTLWQEASEELSAIEFAANVSIWSANDAEAIFDPSAALYQVQYPLDQERPVASLVAPPLVLSCNNFLLDARGTTGLAGRAATFSFASNCSSWLAVSAEALLTVAPRAVFEDGGRRGVCEFTLTVTSFLGVASAPVSAVVRVSDNDFDIWTSIVGPPTGVWTSAESLLLSLELEVLACPGVSRDLEDIEISWGAADEGTGDTVGLDIAIGGGGPLELLVPPGTLDPEASYQFTAALSTSSLPAGETRDASYAAAIQASELVAVIEGPDFRELSQSSPLEIDGSSSFDPDDPLASNSALIFEWSCAIELSLVPCSLGAATTADPILRIDANTLSIGVHAFMLTVRDGAIIGGREAVSRTVRISVVDHDVLSVFIYGARQFSRLQTMRLEGVAGENPLAFTYMWNETSQHGTAYEVDLSDARVLLGREQRNLVISSGMLDPTVPYTFELLATSKDNPDLRGRAAMIVTVLAGPIIASLDAFPAGDARSTVPMHALEADAFTANDDAEPLRYRFGYFPNAATTAEAGDVLLLQDGAAAAVGGVLLSDYSFQSYIEVPLLPGSFRAFVQTIDRLDGVSTRVELVDIPSQGDCDLTPFLEHAESALRIGDVFASLQSINILARTLNDPAFDACLGAGGDLVDVLFSLLERLLLGGNIALSHGQMVADSASVLSMSVPSLAVNRVQTLLNATGHVLQFADALVESKDLFPALSMANDVGEVLGAALEKMEGTGDRNSPYCEVVRTIESQLKSYFALQLGPLLAGESVDLDTVTNLAGGVTRVDVSPSGVSLSGGEEGLRYEASAHVDASSGEVSLVVIALDEAAAHCFGGDGQTVPAGPPVIIEVSANVTTVTFELNFYGTNEVDVCGDPVDFDCGFLNETLDVWEDSGCHTDNRTDLEDGSGTMACTCNHLTTFAVIKTLRTEDECGESVNKILNEVLIIFVLSYTILTLFSSTLIYSMRASTLPRNVTKRAQATRDTLWLILGLSAFQITWMAVYAFEASDIVVACFLLVARGFMYWVFSMVLFQWLSIATWKMNAAGSDRKTKWWIIAGMVSVFVAMMVVGGTYWVTTDEGTIEQVEIAANAVLAVINIITLGTFCGSGYILLRKFHSSARDSGAAGAKRAISDTAMRILRITLAFCAVFLFQTTIILVAVFAPALFKTHFAILMSVYLFFDVVGAAIVLVICRSAAATYNSTSKKARPDPAPIQIAGRLRRKFKGRQSGSLELQSIPSAPPRYNSRSDGIAVSASKRPSMASNGGGGSSSALRGVADPSAPSSAPRYSSMSGVTISSPRSFSSTGKPHGPLAPRSRGSAASLVYPPIVDERRAFDDKRTPSESSERKIADEDRLPSSIDSEPSPLTPMPVDEDEEKRALHAAITHEDGVSYDQHLAYMTSLVAKKDLGARPPTSLHDPFTDHSGSGSSAVHPMSSMSSDDLDELARKRASSHQRPPDDAAKIAQWKASAAHRHAPGDRHNASESKSAPADSNSSHRHGARGASRRSSAVVGSSGSATTSDGRHPPPAGASTFAIVPAETSCSVEMSRERGDSLDSVISESTVLEEV